MENVSVIIAAAGRGKRSGFSKNKVLVRFNGQTCLERTFNAFVKSGVVNRYIVVVDPRDEEEVRAILPDYAEIVLGGATRTESVKNGLAVVNDGIVIIHDAARPFVSERIIKDCVESAKTYGSGICAVPSPDTVISLGEKAKYLGKNGLYRVQTPQAFRVEEIKNAESDVSLAFNDDGEVYLNRYGKLNIVEGSSDNEKLTYPEDFEKLKGKGGYRFGVGFDCHAFAENRKLILGGIEIPHDKGLLGHSDADVLTHAVMDALLSACGLRDIGYYFPDSDEQYKGANSMDLLKNVLALIDGAGFIPDGVTAVIMAEKPKLSKFIPAITENLANAIGIPKDNVGVSATTLEGMGFVGREEGICVHANAVVIKK